jgi:hypothetical protein
MKIVFKVALRFTGFEIWLASSLRFTVYNFVLVFLQCWFGLVFSVKFVFVSSPHIRNGIWFTVYV